MYNSKPTFNDALSSLRYGGPLAALEGELALLNTQHDLLSRCTLTVEGGMATNHCILGNTRHLRVKFNCTGDKS